MEVGVILGMARNKAWEGEAPGEGKEQGTPRGEAWHSGAGYRLPPEHY